MDNFIKTDTDAASLKNIFSAWRSSPALFCEQVLGWTPTPYQTVLLNEMAKPGWKAIGSGHGIGKTSRFAAPLVLWGISCFDPVTIITTAPTWRQVSEQIWRNIHAQYNGSKIPIGGRLKQTGLDFTDSKFALGLSTDDPSKFQGFHPISAQVASKVKRIVIVDEAAGVEENIFIAIDGIATGEDDLVVLLGNPTKTNGRFAECLRGIVPCYRKNISSREAAEYADSIPGLATKKWCDEKLLQWGKDSPLYQSRVLGQLPTESDDTLIRLSWYMSAITRGMENKVKFYNSSEPTIMGLDIARYGTDKTVWIIRRGMAIIEIMDSSRFSDVNRNTMATANYTAKLMRDFHIDRLYLDDTGLGGGVTDRLIEMSFENIYPVNFGAKSTDERFVNRRTDIWWGIREQLQFDKLHICIDNPILSRDLLAPKYKYAAKDQKIALESKDDIRKRCGFSPDFGDALALSLIDSHLENAEFTPFEKDAGDIDNDYFKIKRTIRSYV